MAVLHARVITQHSYRETNFQAVFHAHKQLSDLLGPIPRSFFPHICSLAPSPPSLRPIRDQFSVSSLQPLFARLSAVRSFRSPPAPASLSFSLSENSERYRHRKEGAKCGERGDGSPLVVAPRSATYLSSRLLLLLLRICSFLRTGDRSAPHGSGWDRRGALEVASGAVASRRRRNDRGSSEWSREEHPLSSSSQSPFEKRARK